MKEGMNRGPATRTVAAICALAMACGGADEGTPATSDVDTVVRPQVEMQTRLGRMVIELFPERAPGTVDNFLAYVDEGFYDGLVFHRVIPGFVIQAGGFTADMKKRQPTHPPIRNESDNGFSNRRGTLSMARTQAPHSASSQFYVNLADNLVLDYGAQAPGRHGYAVFGSVIEGMEVVDAIAAVQTGGRGGMQDVPLEPVIVESVRRLP